MGYNLITIRECEWNDLRRRDVEINAFVSRLDSRNRRTEPWYVESELIERVRRGDLFGLIECDIHVPDALKQRFAEMPPIFKNTMVGRDSLSATMRAHSAADNTFNSWNAAGTFSRSRRSTLPA